MVDLGNILQNLTLGEWTVIFVAVATACEKFFNFKIWSWLFGNIGNKLNANLLASLNTFQKEVGEQVDTIQKDIVDLRKELDDTQFSTVRKEIIDFASSVLNGKVNTLEQYGNILSAIGQYENKFGSMHNGELKETIRVIKDEYSAFCKKTMEENRDTKTKSSS